MKCVTSLIVFAFACLSIAPWARAENLRITPANPAADQSFTIDLDYRTPCEGSGGDVSAVLVPPGPGVDRLRIEVRSGIRCFESGISHTVHFAAVMVGIPAGSYPIYTAIGIGDGFDPPRIDVLLQGNVVVGTGPASLPTLSPWASWLLAIAVGAIAVGAQKHRRSAARHPIGR